MTPILEQFLSESRDFVHGIGDKLIQLEQAPDDVALMSELFRLVHTLKGNCGLFDFPELARVLHAAEDLMVMVREGRLAYSQALADGLLEATDFVSLLLDEIEASGSSSARHAATSATLADALRALIVAASIDDGAATADAAAAPAVVDEDEAAAILSQIPEALRLAWSRRSGADEPVRWLRYRPEAECFFKGEDPFFQARQTPHLVWQSVTAREPLPALAELDGKYDAINIKLDKTGGLAPAIALMSFVLGLNLLADSLREQSLRD